jgi:hypothetical protein
MTPFERETLALLTQHTHKLDAIAKRLTPTDGTTWLAGDKAACRHLGGINRGTLKHIAEKYGIKPSNLSTGKHGGTNYWRTAELDAIPRKELKK